MVQHYFASAWIPQQGVKRDIYVEKIDPTLYRVGVKQPVPTIAPGQIGRRVRRACSPVRKKSACSKASRRVWNW